MTLVFFGPQAPVQALGALAIAYLSYRQLYLAGAAIAVTTALAFLRVTRPGRPAQDAPARTAASRAP